MVGETGCEISSPRFVEGVDWDYGVSLSLMVASGFDGASVDQAGGAV